jgi:hypothetical protein
MFVLLGIDPGEARVGFPLDHFTTGLVIGGHDRAVHEGIAFSNVSCKEREALHDVDTNAW